MVSALAIPLELPGTHEEPQGLVRPALLISRESQERDQRKQKRLLQKARLRLEASVHDTDYQPARNRERSRIAQLSQNEWVLRGETHTDNRPPAGVAKPTWAAHRVTTPAIRDTACSYGD